LTTSRLRGLWTQRWSRSLGSQGPERDSPQPRGDRLRLLNQQWFCLRSTLSSAALLSKKSANSMRSSPSTLCASSPPCW